MNSVSVLSVAMIQLVKIQRQPLCSLVSIVAFSLPLPWQDCPGRAQKVFVSRTQQVLENHTSTCLIDLQTARLSSFI